MRKKKTTAIKKNVIPRKKKPVKKIRVARTRNGNTWTEAEFWQKIRSGMRNISRWWVVARLAKEKARRKYTGKDKRLKWEYKCNICKNYFPEKQIACHHSVQVGSLNCAEDLPGFVNRLFTENIGDYEILCHKCHLAFHNTEKENKKLLK